MCVRLSRPVQGKNIMRGSWRPILRISDWTLLKREVNDSVFCVGFFWIPSPHQFWDPMILSWFLGHKDTQKKQTTSSNSYMEGANISWIHSRDEFRSPATDPRDGGKNTHYIIATRNISTIHVYPGSLKPHKKLSLGWSMWRIPDPTKGQSLAVWTFSI